MTIPLFATQAVALDRRPLIEIWHASHHGERLTLSGTASVYEGNVLVEIQGRDGSTTIQHTQATTGGSGRGTWSIDIAITDAVSLLIGQEEMEEAAATAATRRISMDLTRWIAK